MAVVLLKQVPLYTNITGRGKRYSFSFLGRKRYSLDILIITVSFKVMNQRSIFRFIFVKHPLNLLSKLGKESCAFLFFSFFSSILLHVSLRCALLREMSRSPCIVGLNYKKFELLKRPTYVCTS